MRMFTNARSLLLALLFPFCAATQMLAETTQIVPASDPRFRYEGRFDFASSNAPAVIWQASRISLDFSGDTIGLLFDNAKGQNFFNAQVDVTNQVVSIPEGLHPQPVALSGFGDGRHHLVLFKRSEASAGTVQFRGVEVLTNGSAWSPQPSRYKLRMEFIGDSITVGACNEDGAEDQWTNRLTHNAALSYATLTADKIYPNPSSPRANLAQWIPRVIFVNLGENDDSFPRAHGQAFPTNYTSGYVTLARAIRSARPDARIVILRGGMYGGAQSEPLRAAWESAVTQLEAGDPGISHFVFKHWTNTHPRVADDRIMAGELIDWLKQQPFMQPYR
jgi:lysophospholipase L1-like esterase